MFWRVLRSRGSEYADVVSYLRDTLLVLSAEKNSPCNAAWVLALEEERLRLSVLETEDLGISTDVELAL